MRVKVGNTWYEAKPGQPIMVELTKNDKHNIERMLPWATKYALFDDAEEMTRQQMLDWMENEGESNGKKEESE